MNDPVSSLPRLPWTADMANLWNAAMLIYRTQTAYGRNPPVPGCHFPRPPAGGLVEMLLWVATATPDEMADFYARVAADNAAWKRRVAMGRRSPTRPDAAAIRAHTAEIIAAISAKE